jgi:hypothetical protein
MLGDNQRSLALAKNPDLPKIAKYINICYHFIRDLKENIKVITSDIKAIDIIADSITRPL